MVIGNFSAKFHCKYVIIIINPALVLHQQ